MTVAAYAPVWQFGFVTIDDPTYVTRNPHVQAGLTGQGIAWAFGSFHAANWHPLTWISHMTDVSLFGVAAGPSHAVNLALHLVNAWLLWLLLLRLTGAMWRGAIVAGLFALHPLHVESVAWIAERKDVLSTCFALLTLLAYTRYVARPSARRYAAMTALLVLGLLTKPMLVTLPFVMLLLDAWPLGRVAGAADARPTARPWRSLVLEKAPLIALAGASSLVTLVAQRQGGALASTEALPFVVRAAHSAVAYATYIGQLVWPVDLAVYYPHPVEIEAVPALISAAVLAGLCAGVVLLRRHGSIVTGWLWFLGTLVPVIGLVQVGAQSTADRYTYIPSIGFFLAVVWGLSDLAARTPARRRVLAGAAAIALAACAAATHAQVRYWKDGETVWRRAVAVTRPNSRAHTSLGATLAGAGRTREAIVEYERALAIQPLPETHNDLGLALVDLGERPAAIEHFREAVRLRPTYAEAMNHLANALMEDGQADEALGHYEEAIRLRPGIAEFHHNYGTALGEAGRLPEATREFLEAVRLEPNRAEWHFSAGLAFTLQGETGRAIEELRAAVRLDPSHARARQVLNDLTRGGR